MAVAARSRTAGGHVAAFLHEYVRQSKGRWAGAPLELEGWQRAFIDEAFLLDDDGVRVYTDAVLGIPRKNGKSTIASGLGLYLLAADGENQPEVYAGAGSKEQARIVFDQAALMVQKSPRLLDFLRVQRHDITAPFCDGIFKVIASDGDLQQGSNPHGAIIDELWAHKNGRLFTALTTGSGAREQPLALTITTAGRDLEDPEAPLAALVTKALALPPGMIDQPEPFLTVVRDRANGFLLWWYGPLPGLHEHVDLEDPAVWKACNPASWMTEKYLGKQRHSPKVRLHEFQRFHLNHWTDVEEAWIDPEELDAGIGVPDLSSGDVVCGGVDIGQRKDSTAVAVATVVGRDVHLKVKIRVPTPNQPVQVAQARADVLEFHGALGLEEVAYDRFGFSESAELLEEMGVPMVDFDQGHARMAPASELIYELIRDGRLVWDGDPELRRQFLSAVPLETERGVRISKKRSKRRIDAAVAATMAVSRAMHYAQDGTASPFVEVVR